MTGEAPRFDEAEFLRRTYALSLQEMERSRAYFEMVLKRTFWALGVLVGIGLFLLAFFSVRSWNDVQARMDQQLKETQDAIQSKGRETIKQTEENIRKQAELAFQQDSLKRYIREVASEKTERQLSSIIERAVTEQVAGKVREEEPRIEKITVDQTRRALDAMSPSINALVTKKVNEEVGPIRQQQTALEHMLTVNTAVIQARNGDGKSYDAVRQLAVLSPDPNIKSICVSTLNQIFLEMNGGIYLSRNFLSPKSIEEMKALLNDPSPLIRWAAIDSLAAKGEKGVVSKLVFMSTHDDFLIVRKAAFEALRALTGQKFENFQEDGWSQWWEKNKGNWPSQ